MQCEECEKEPATRIVQTIRFAARGEHTLYVANMCFSCNAGFYDTWKAFHKVSLNLESVVVEIYSVSEVDNAQPS